MSHDSSPADRRSISPGRARRLGGLAAAAGLCALFAARMTAGGLAPGEEHPFTATAYCDRGTTKSGVQAQRGVAAADPAVLPVGSVVRVSSDSSEHEGIYTVMDTGGKVTGRRIDLFVHDCRQARRFGLRQVLVRVLRLGWNPQASARPTTPHLAFVSARANWSASTRPAGGPAAAPDDLSDGAITAKVKSRLALDETIRSRDIHVSTKDAVVTLSGQVASDAERSRAVTLARETEGVKSVVDRLEVKK